MAIGVGAIVVGSFSTAVSIAGITRYDQPERALAFLPFDAVANAVLADRIQQTAPQNDGEAERLAQRALSRTPISPTALRVLGFIADGKGEQDLAARRISFAWRLSRRDLPTNLWMVEDAVRRNDVPGALDRYDVALRTSRLAAPVLFPVLAGALADPEFVQPVTKVLRRNPPWVTEFIPWALHQGSASENITRVLEGLPATTRQRDEQLAVTAVGQLVAEQRYTTAARLLDSPIARSAGAAGSIDAQTLRPLGLESAIPTFAWSLVQTADLGADPAKLGVSLFARSGMSGVVASRLLVLAPGSYRITTVGAAMAGDVRWTVSCGGTAPERVIAELSVPSASGAVAATFTVNGACTGQWLRLLVRNPSQSDELNGSVASVGVARVSRP